MAVSLAALLAIAVTFCVVLVAVVCVQGDNNDSALKFTRKYKAIIANHTYFDSLKTAEELQFETQASNRTYGSDFPCEPCNSTTKASSVHRLRPCDVGVVAALGDSITTAFGAESNCLITLFAEYRGISWSIGGDHSLQKVLTLPNIIKNYNPEVTGFSVKVTPPRIPIPWKEHLDVAVTGAVSKDLLQQANKLIKRLKKYPAYHFQNSWKVLTIFIGGNDLCDLCKSSEHTPEMYVDGIKRALDVLHQQVPRMFVNIVQILDVTRLNALSSLYCRALHSIVCSCGTTKGLAWQKKVQEATLDYQRLVKELIDSRRYDTRDDFTVVIQPFLTGTTIPHLPSGKADRSYFAPDCFHFSAKAHAAAALALWNNMVEPIGRKRTMWSLKEKFECPTKNFPYFFTYKNSKEYLQRLKKTVDANSSDEGDFLLQSTIKRNKAKTNTVSKLKLFAVVGILLILLIASLFLVVKTRNASAIENNQREIQSNKSVYYGSLE